MIKLREMEFIIIKMEINIKENLKTENPMDLAVIIIYAEVKKMINMKGKFIIGIKKEKVFIILKTEIDMKEIL